MRRNLLLLETVQGGKAGQVVAVVFTFRWTIFHIGANTVVAALSQLSSWAIGSSGANM